MHDASSPSTTTAARAGRAPAGQHAERQPDDDQAAHDAERVREEMGARRLERLQRPPRAPAMSGDSEEAVVAIPTSTVALPAGRRTARMGQSERRGSEPVLSGSSSSQNGRSASAT